MRNTFADYIEAGRIRHGEYWSDPGELSGAFQIQGPCGQPLYIIASCGDADVCWEHVSVSLRNRTPNWAEMCFVKDAFWLPEETVLQFHPPQSQYVNLHPFCLHLWRPLDWPIILPPLCAV